MSISQTSGLSIQIKIIFITIAIITLILSAYATVNVINKNTAMHAELNELAAVTAEKLKNNLRIPLWNLDVELVSDTVKAEMLTQDISAIQVFDSDGATFVAGKMRGDKWGVLDATTSYQFDPEDELKRETIIENNNENIGRVVVYVSKQFRRQELYDSVIGVLITVLFLDVSIFLILWFVINNLLRKPIKKLSEAANQISRGRVDAFIDLNRGDEIGLMAHSIERMKTSLRIAIERLREIEKKKKAYAAMKANKA